MNQRPDYAWEIRSALTDARRLCEGLGIDLRNARRQGERGLMVCCPVHQERTPSCSIRPGPDHTLQIRCWGCDFTGDALTLVAAVRQHPRSAFRETLAEAATIAGLHQVVDELRNGRPAPDRPAPKPLPPPEPPKPYMPIAEVSAVWNRSTPVTTDGATSGYLVRRLLDPELVAARSLARVLVAPAPAWATYGGRSWLNTAHRLLFRVFDAWGNARGIRGSCVEKNDTPKRLPATGYRAGELVLANRAAWAMLRGDAPSRILIAEGETDWLTLATIHPEEVPVLGVGSGSWSANFAAAIPRSSDVYIYTDPDDAGERYAKQITESLGEKCRTWRAA